MKSTSFVKTLLATAVFFLFSSMSSRAADNFHAANGFKVFYYPDSTMEVNPTIGMTPSYRQSLLFKYTYLTGKQITFSIVRGQRALHVNHVIPANKNGRSVMDLRLLGAIVKEGDRLMIQYSIYTIIIPITEKAKDVTPSGK